MLTYAAMALAGLVLLAVAAVGRGRLLDTYRRLPLELRDTIFATCGSAVMVSAGVVFFAACVALIAAGVLGVALLFTVSPVAAIVVVCGGALLVGVGPDLRRGYIGPYGLPRRRRRATRR
jgi:multisubunit Na+/H+ antiporter MnhG subunit